jgi:hypothetical protein
MGASATFSNDLESLRSFVAPDASDLEYEVTTENVCFSEEMLFHMKLTTRIMIGIATHVDMPPAFKSAAQLAAWLMAETGPIQTHGLACVHKECVECYLEMYLRIEQLFHVPATPTTVYEAVRMVLVLGMQQLQNDAELARVVDTIADLDRRAAHQSTFHFGLISHQCVPLYTLGTVDPDGAPNLYQ